jgi:hypothetical protein
MPFNYLFIHFWPTFVTKQAGRIYIAIAFLSIFTGCGGGGDSSATKIMSWEQNKYTFQATGNAAFGAINTVIHISGAKSPSGVVVSINPNGNQTNPTPGTGPFIAQSDGSVAVTFSVHRQSIPGVGIYTYPPGIYSFTAIAQVDGQTLTATTYVEVP